MVQQLKYLNPGEYVTRKLNAELVKAIIANYIANSDHITGHGYNIDVSTVPAVEVTITRR